MNGGCSGGPVFAYFEATQEWSIVGVNNRGTSRADGFGDPASPSTWTTLRAVLELGDGRAGLQLRPGFTLRG